MKMEKSREVIGTIIVKTDNGDIKTVIVSQEVISQYNKNYNYAGKHLTLETINGPTVFQTDEENIFRLEDGSELRIRKN